MSFSEHHDAPLGGSLAREIFAPKINERSSAGYSNVDPQKVLERREEPKSFDSTNHRDSPKHSGQRSRKKRSKQQTTLKHTQGVGIIKTRSLVILSVVVCVILVTGVYATIGSHAQITELMKGMSVLSSDKASYRSQVARDSTAPMITGVQDVISEATSQLTQIPLTAPKVVDDVDPTPTLTQDAPSNGFPLGTNAVTWTATDDAGNTATALQRVTLIDTTPPTIIAPTDFIVYVSSSTSYTQTPLGVASVTDLVDRSPFVTNNAPTQFSVGVTTVTWTALDASGNSATDTQLVTVMIKDSTTSSSSSGSVTSGTVSGTGSSGTTTTQDTSSSSITSTSTSSATTQTSTTSAGGSSPSGKGGSGGGGGSGKTTGSGGGSGSTRVDTTPPKIFQPAKIIAEATGKLTSIQLQAPKVTDNSDPTPTVTSNAPASFPLGTTIVTWTAKDASGNTATADQQVTIQDTIAPSIVAPSNIVTQATSPLTSVSLGAATASDLVDPSPHISNDAPANGFWVGNTTVTWTAVDASGNIAKAMQKITIVDFTPPIIVAPDDITAYTASASNPIAIPLGAAYVYDTADKTPTVTNDAPAAFSVGTTMVIWTARDASGNTATDVQKISVILLDSSGSNSDTTPPAIIAPSDLKVNSTGVLTAVQLGTPVVTDNSDPHPTVSNNAPAGGFPVGKTTVTWTATDASGNSAKDTQIVAVVASQNSTVINTGSDLTPPTIVAPPHITTQATGVLTSVNLGTPVVSDNSDPHPTVSNNAPAGGFPVGNTTVTWKATDAAGNSATATQLVTIQEAGTYYTIPIIDGVKPTNVTYGSTVYTVCDSGCTHTTIKSAMDALPSNGGKVILKGSKIFSPSSTIYLRSNLVIEFEAGTTMKYSGSGNVFTGSKVNNVMFINPVISRSTVGDGIYFSSADNIIVQGGKITGVKGSTSSGFKCLSCMNVLVQGGSYSTFSRPITFWTLSGTTDGTNRNIWMVENTIFDSSIECVHFNRGYGMHAIRNNVSDCTNNGIDVGYNVGVEAIGNKITRAGYGTTYNAVGIHTDSSNTVVLRDNLIDLSGTNGISVCGSDNNYVIGNTIRSSGQLVTDTRFAKDGHGIEVIACAGGAMTPDHSVVDKNIVESSNDGYGVYIGSAAVNSWITSDLLTSNEYGGFRSYGTNTTIADNVVG